MKSTKSRVNCDKKYCLDEKGTHNITKRPFLRFANTKKGVTLRATVLSVHEVIVAVGYEAQTATPSTQATNKATTQVGVATRHHGNLTGHHLVAFRALNNAGDFCSQLGANEDLWLGDCHLVGYQR